MEQKKAIIICGEVLCERSWSGTIEKNCTTTLLSIVEDIRKKHHWHDGKRRKHMRVLRACEDKMGRRITVAAFAELWADGKRKHSNDASRDTKEEVVFRRRVVHETVVMSRPRRLMSHVAAQSSHRTISVERAVVSPMLPKLDV
jgi:hypothetical protein